MSPSAQSQIALKPSMLANGPLLLSALSPEALLAILMPGIDGDRSRQLLRYTVSCALAPSDVFSFVWTDLEGVLRQESYPGLLGLAVNWRDHAPSASDLRWVSACLAARVNWYGVPVTISSRGSKSGLNKAGAEELTHYDVEEGAFWGNVFTQTPQLYACHYGPNKSYARGELRDCAAGHINDAGQVESCGIIQIVGDCRDYCDSLHPVGVYRQACGTTPGVWSTQDVVTVFLE